MPRCSLLGLFVLAALASQVKSAVITPQIISGAQATRDQFKYQVALENPEGMCGGSIISSEWILTAAHCVDSVVNKLDVMIGVFDKSVFEEGRVIMETTNTIVHENYDKATVNNDVALVKLTMPITLPNPHWAVVSLPTQADIASNTYVGVTATASGWGAIRNGGNETINKLNFVALTMITNADCSQSARATIPDSRICGQGDYNGVTKGVCQGDSGGPLVYTDNTGKQTQIGIMSYVLGGCEELNPSVFTRVSFFMAWISSKTNITIAP